MNTTKKSIIINEQTESGSCWWDWLDEDFSQRFFVVQKKEEEEEEKIQQRREQESQENFLLAFEEKSREDK